MPHLVTIGSWIALCAGPAFGAQVPPLFVFEGEVPKVRLGIAVDGTGDVDGDGVPDFVIGESEGSATSVVLGRVTVYSGVDGSPLWTWDEPEVGTAFGASAAGAGDVNADGFADVIVGARYDDTFATFSGKATVFSGRDGSVLHEFLGDGEGDRLGNAVAGVGDVDGDGHDDLLVGSFFDNTAAFWAGRAIVFSGKSGKVLHEFLGNDSFDFLGAAVGGAGDVDGDGTPDLIVGMTGDDARGGNAGLAHVYSGATGAVLHTFLGDAAGDEFGASVDGAGDVNGDGHADLIVGAWMADDPVSNAGLARVFSGLDGSTLFEVRGTAGHHVGVAVAGVGDTDGDGFDDVLVGADFDDEALGTPAGSARVYSGANGDEVLSIVGTHPHARLGQAVGGAGDVDGDGLADVIVGAPHHDAGGYNAGWSAVHAGIAEVGEPYCGPAVPNSTGAPAEISAFGSELVAANRLQLVASSMPQDQPGYFLTSLTEGFVAGPGGSAGNLCLGGAIGRFSEQVASSGSEGRFEVLVDLTALPFNPPQAVAPGETWHFQAWFRDLDPVPTSNFTAGVKVTFE